MKYLMLLLALLGILAFSSSLVGCEDQGPFEEAGEEIDDALEEAGDAIGALRDG